MTDSSMRLIVWSKAKKKKANKQIPKNYNKWLIFTVGMGRYFKPQNLKFNNSVQMPRIMKFFRLTISNCFK